MTSKEIDADATRDPREQILSGVRKGHSVTLDAFKVVVDKVAPVTSKVPAPKLPAAKIPAVSVPRPDLAGAREFAGQLRDEQRKFNGEFLRTAAGLHPVFGGAEDETAAEAVHEDGIPHGPHGAGSAHPLADGSAPHERFHIKGNADSGLFHTKESPSYKRTGAEVWFESEDHAAAAGYKHWNHKKH